MNFFLRGGRFYFFASSLKLGFAIGLLLFGFENTGRATEGPRAPLVWILSPNSLPDLFPDLKISVEARLPESILEFLGKTFERGIEVSFAENLFRGSSVTFSNEEAKKPRPVKVPENPSGQCLLGQLGSHRVELSQKKLSITLKRELLETLRQSRSLSFPCDGLAQDHLIARVVIRELVKVYDNLNENRFSLDRAFLNMNSWNRKGLLWVNTSHDVHPLRTSDPSEYFSPQESLASHMERAILDRSYPCRRPDTYPWLKEKFGLAPAGPECKMNRKIPFLAKGAQGSNEPFETLDPSRLYRIDYLLASKGQTSMSKFGHAMFRLVFCAPGKDVGPKCLNHHFHHRVISFGALVNNQNIEIWKGLVGDYPSIMGINSLDETQKTYTVVEDRSLEPYPLKLTKEQMQRFLDVALVKYWSYEGDYYFFQNNCATEALNLFQAAFPEHARLQWAHARTPVGLRDILEELDLLDTKWKKDLSQIKDKKTREVLTEEASDNFIFFPSLSQNLAATTGSFFVEGSSLKKFGTVENLIKNSSLSERQAYFEAEKRRILGLGIPFDSVSPHPLFGLLATMILVEDSIMQKIQASFHKEVRDAMESEITLNAGRHYLPGELLDFVRTQAHRLSPRSAAGRGYGIPTEDEIFPIDLSAISIIQQIISKTVEFLKTKEKDKRAFTAQNIEDIAYFAYELKQELRARNRK